MTVRPNRNLPPMAEPWGRWSDEQIDALWNAAQSLGANVGGDARAGSSSMDNIAAQVSELFARQVAQFTFAAATIVPPAPDSWSSTTVSIAIPPPPGGHRIAQIAVTGTYTAATAEASTVFLTGRVNGAKIFQINGPVPYLASAPPGFSPSIEAYGGIVIPESGATLELEFQSAKFTANPQTITADGLLAAITFGQIIR